jgi:hypothetical protein
MGGYSDAKTLDDESASTVSFVDVPSGSIMLPAIGEDEPKTRPHVLYVLQYLGDHNTVLDSRLSNPFSHCDHFAKTCCSSQELGAVRVDPRAPRSW